MVAAADLRSASRTHILVITRICVPDADLGLEIPMFAEHPRITVCYAGTGEPTLVTVILQIREFGAEKVRYAAYITDVVLAAPEVRSEEVTAESLAGPVAYLGLHEPMFPLLVIGESPRVVVAREIERPLLRQSELHAEVHARCGVVEEIALYGPLLRLYGARETRCHEDKQQYQIFFHSKKIYCKIVKIKQDENRFGVAVYCKYN